MATIQYIALIRSLLLHNDTKILVFMIGTFIAIAVDMVTGWWKSIVTKTPSSDIGTKGLLKHLSLFLLLSVTAMFAIAIGDFAIVLWYALTIYYWVLQAQSVLENLDAIGVDIKGFKIFIQAISNSEQPKEENTKNK